MIYDTSEMIKMISKDTELIFTCFSGRYEGKSLYFNTIVNEITWSINLRIRLNRDFLSCKWVIVQPLKERIIPKTPLNIAFAQAQAVLI